MLRFGVIVDPGDLPWWQVEAIRKLIETEQAQLALVIENRAGTAVASLPQAAVESDAGQIVPEGFPVRPHHASQNLD